MKTIFKLIISLVFMAALLLGGALFYTSQSSGELAGIMDQLNPLVKEGEIYVKTTTPESVNEYGTAAYRQTAADSEGHTRTIEFNGIQELKTDHYLKITNKGAHVITYEEVTKEEVPQPALAKID